MYIHLYIYIYILFILVCVHVPGPHPCGAVRDSSTSTDKKNSKLSVLVVLVLPKCIKIKRLPNLGIHPKGFNLVKALVFRSLRQISWGQTLQNFVGNGFCLTKQAITGNTSEWIRSKISSKWSYNPTYDINRRLHSIAISNLSSYTLPKTNSSPLKIGRLSQKERKDRLPSIHFQLMFQGYSNPISSSPSLCQGFKPPPHFCGENSEISICLAVMQLWLCVACQCLVVGSGGDIWLPILQSIEKVSQKKSTLPTIMGS